MAEQYIFTMQNLRKVVPPQREILRGIYLSFFPGAKIGILGLNGAGKSTVLRIMAGLDKEFTGEAFPAEGTRIGHLSQDPQLDPKKTVLENVEEGVAPLKALLVRFEELGEKMGESLSEAEMDKVMAEYGRVQDAIEAANGWELDRTLETAMDALRCPPPDADVTKISGGEKRRVALCRLLLSRPDMLLLDEPTNHLDAESVAWLEQFLKEFPGTVVAVTHDRYFLDNVAGWILELDRGAGIPWKGNYSSWLEQKEARLEIEEKTETARQRSLKRELEWVRMSPRARQAKSKARLQAYEQLVSESGVESRGETNEIYIPPGPRLGDVVVRAEGVRKSFGDKLLFDDLSFDLPKGGIVGVIGPNGAGKTTLFKMIMGAAEAGRGGAQDVTPDSGKLQVGETVVPSYVDQNREKPDAKKTVHDELSGGQDLVMLGKREMPSRAFCAMYNFKGADQQKLVANLSGGEMNRLHLAGRSRRAGTSSSSTSRRTTSTSTRSARSRRRSCPSADAPSSSATTAGSSIASRRTCSRSRATAKRSGTRATTGTTRPTATSGSVPRPTSRTGSSTGRSDSRRFLRGRKRSGAGGPRGRVRNRLGGL